MLTGCRSGVVDWSGGVFAICITQVQLQLYVNACIIGWPQFALQHHWLLPINCHFRDCKALWSGYRVSYAALYKNPTFLHLQFYLCLVKLFASIFLLLFIVFVLLFFFSIILVNKDEYIVLRCAY